MMRSSTSLIRFLACGAVAAAIVWIGLTWLGEFASGSATHTTIKTAMNAGSDAGGGPTSWDTIEEAQFQEFARHQGWKDIRLVTRIFMGDDIEKYIASQIAGEGPDVVIASREQLAFFDEQGLIEPLDAYLQQWSDYQEGQFNKQLLDASRGRDGKILGLPVHENAPGVFVVRRDWLERLGLQSPTTFAEARELWRACTHGDPDGNGQTDTYGYELTMQTRGGGHLYSLAPFMFAVRAPWYRLDDDRNYVPAFNTPEAASVLDFIKQCYKEGLFGKDVMVRSGPSSATYRFFANQQAAMTGPVFVDWFDLVADQNGMADKVQLVPFLWLDEQARDRGIYGAVTYLTRMRCMMKSSSKKLDSWKYLQYFFSKQWLKKILDRRGQPIQRGEYLGQFGLFSNETPWRMIRNDVTARSLLDAEQVALVLPVEQHIIRTPLMSAWPEVATAICEVIVDYYNDLYPTAQTTLDEAERKFQNIMAQKKSGKI